MSDWKNVQYKDGKFKTSTGGGGGGSSTLAGLDDVNFSNLQDGQVPKYNSTTQKWENANESGGGGTVTDVEVDGVSVVNQQGVAEIELPSVPVQDVQVGGTSVVDSQGVANITIPTPPTPDYPVTDVKVNGSSVVTSKVANITSYKEVTQAQYEALPDTKLSDGVLYCIKDSAGADGFPPLIYSDEEREVGVWCDGKPLYQKTFRFNETAKNFSIDISQLNINEIISVQGMFTRLVSGYPRFWYPMSNYESTAVYGSLQISGANGVENQVLSWYLVVEATDRQIITIQYTKTTDTAGSGTWTTQGSYAHHYSTSEKVIGTWIDGKPLYEKSFEFTGSFAGGNHTLTCGFTNIKHFRRIEAFARRTDGFEIPIPWLDIGALSWSVGLRPKDATLSDMLLCIGNEMGAYSPITYLSLTVQYTKTTD